MGCAVQAQNLHQLGYLCMVPRRLHPVAPRNLLLLGPVLFYLGLAIFRLAQCSKRGMLLIPWRRNGRRDMERLEEKLAAHLAMVARFERQALGHLFQALDDAVEDPPRRALLCVCWLVAHVERLDHAQRIKQRPGRVCIYRERTARLLGVHVDQRGVATANDGDEGADGESEQGIGGDAFGEGTQVFLAVLEPPGVCVSYCRLATR